MLFRYVIYTILQFLTRQLPCNAFIFLLIIGGGWLYRYWPLTGLDPFSPGLLFSAFLVLAAIVNLPVVRAGPSLALNRWELILV